MSWEWRRGLLMHPATVVALLALLVNDRVLKAASGGVEGAPGTVARLVTGKVSDFAGVALLAIVVTVVTGRWRFSVGSVAVGFVALKTLPGVAEAAAPVLGGVTRRDAADLIGLAVLVPVGRMLARRAQAENALEGGTGTGSARGEVAALRGARGWVGPAGSRTARAAAQGLVAMVAIVAISATSYPERGVERLEVHDGVVFAYQASGSVARSDDSGITWQREPRSDASDDPRDEDDQHAPIRETNEEVCTADDWCYRLNHRDYHRVVEEMSPGAAWEVVFEFTPEQQAVRSSRGRNEVGVIGSIVVVDDVVLVGNGAEGVLRRERGAEWQRVAVGANEPEYMPGWDDVAKPAEISAWPVIAAMASGFSSLAAVVAIAPRRKWLAWVSAVCILFGLAVVTAVVALVLAVVFVSIEILLADASLPPWFMYSGWGVALVAPLAPLMLWLSPAPAPPAPVVPFDGW